MSFDGLLNMSTWGLVAVALLLTHVTIASVTIFLHRHQAHRALTLHWLPSHFFRFWLWLTTGMVTREWVAVHRKHHARCEAEEDPHSPQQHGIWKVLFGGTWLYRNEAGNAETIAAFSAGTPDDWIERNLYARHRFVGLGVMAAIDVVLFGWAGLAIFVVQMLWIPFWAAGVINGVGHYWGYRNFETQDASRNIVPIGLLIGGEELHNNHHAYGTSARLSNKWWEFDVGWLYIRLLEIVGLAKVRRKAPKTTFASQMPAVDMDMLSAVVTNRFHVMKLYGSRVVRPVVRDEARALNGEARAAMRRVRQLIAREDPGAVDGAKQRHLEEVLGNHASLKTVYDFKLRLKDLWTQKAKGQQELLARLQAWCIDAESSGVAALEEFARQLRCYRTQLA